MTQQQHQRGGSLSETPQGLYTALAMIFLIAVSLRTGLIGVGPLLPDITDDLGLSNTNASLLVALPPILMGLAAVPGGRLADRSGARWTITIGLAGVAIAGGLRAIAPSFVVLILLTVLFGIGIGICQPAFPRIGRSLLPRRMGFATAVFTAGFFSGAVLAASITGPVFLSSDRNDDWRLPLGVWGVMATLTLIGWLLSFRRWHVAPPAPLSTPAPSAARSVPGWSPWRDRPTWIVAGIFAAQGLAYYILVAWLPSIYDEAGLRENDAALLFTLFNFATFPAMVGLPILSDRVNSRRLPTIAAALVFLIGSTGLAVAATGSALQWLWPIFCGFGLAGLFGMGMLMPVDTARSGTLGQTAGMVLAIGYVASGLGPVIAGAIQDLTGSFDLALRLLPMMAILAIILAWFSPAPRQAVRVT